MNEDDEKAEIRAERDAAESRQQQQQEEKEDAILDILEHGVADEATDDRKDDEMIVEKRAIAEQEKVMRAGLANSGNHAQVPLSQATDDGGGAYSLMSTFANVPAGDIPVPTELQRHVSEPGALEVDGLAPLSESMRMRRSVIIGGDDDDDGPIADPDSATPMLLTATLVEDSNRHLPPDEDEENNATAEMAPKQPVLAMAEPLEEKSKEDDDNLLPGSEEKRRRLFMILGIIICLCVCGGVGLGVGFAKLGAEDEDSLVECRCGPCGGQLETDRRMYYYLQWGSISAGCTPPKDAPLYLSCQNGGTLGFLEIPSDVNCTNTTDTEGSTYMVCKHVLDGDQPYTNVDGSAIDNGDLVVDGNVTTANLTLGSRRIVAFCDGILDDYKSMVLAARVSLDEERKIEKEEDVPREERFGFCNHLWVTVPSNENVTTEARFYGGAGQAFLSTAIICAAPGESQCEDARISLDGTSCTTVGGVQVGQLDNNVGNESVPFCSRVNSCVKNVNGCPVEQAENDPCKFADCTLSFTEDIQSAPPSDTDIRFCSARADMKGLNQEIIKSAVDPYALTVIDFDNLLRPLRDQLIPLPL